MKISPDEINIRLGIIDHIQVSEFEDVATDSIQMSCETILDK